MDEIKLRLKNKVKNVSFQAGIIRRFRDEVQIGDYFILTSPNSEYFLLGQITGDFEYNPKFYPRYRFSCYRRTVKWISKVNRENLSLSAKRSLSAQITVFKVKDKWQKEIFKNQEPLDFKSNNKFKPVTPKKENNDYVKENINISDQENKKEEFTKDKIFFKYAELYKEGLITKEEFEIKKKELL